MAGFFWLAEPQPQNSSQASSLLTIPQIMFAEHFSPALHNDNQCPFVHSNWWVSDDLTCSVAFPAKRSDINRELSVLQRRMIKIISYDGPTLLLHFLTWRQISYSGESNIVQNPTETNAGGRSFWLGRQHARLYASFEQLQYQNILCLSAGFS